MKTLNELTLFDEVMDIPEAHEAALRIILGDENLRLLTPSQTEKELRTAQKSLLSERYGFISPKIGR